MSSDVICMIVALTIICPLSVWAWIMADKWKEAEEKRIARELNDIIDRNLVQEKLKEYCAKCGGRLIFHGVDEVAKEFKCLDCSKIFRK